MIPYVRKSFYKHYINGLKYVENVSHYEEMTGDDIAETSIDEDFYKLYSRAYKYAMDMTTKEVYQAVEGMYHNLKIWA